MKKNILVFPCGSEVALEIFRSLRYSSHFYLIGANSIDDHGRFFYKDYIGNVPFVSSPRIIQNLKEIVDSRKIDAIYPAMDLVNSVLKNSEDQIGCKIIGSCKETVNICASKRLTYNILSSFVKVPKIFDPNQVDNFPVFSKPDIGYGSRNTQIIYNKDMLSANINNFPHNIICQYLPGDEYTVDCFTDKYRNLKVCIPRKRIRIENGISTNTKIVAENIDEFRKFAIEINNILEFRGAWFFQVKRDENSKLCLLEVASRIGGSSGIVRNLGINLALLTLFDAFDFDVEIISNDYYIEFDRALDEYYKIGIDYNEVYIDLDDCIIIDDQLNIEMIKFLYQCINRKIKITLLTRHRDNIYSILALFRIENIFDRVFFVAENRNKSEYIDNRNSIFIDDSFAERKSVHNFLKIPVFSPDMIRSLLE